MNAPEYKVRLALSAAISPSEDPEKVATALTNVFGEGKADLSMHSRAELVTEDPKVLVRIRNQLRDRHIRTAARRQMLLNAREGSTSLMLNRQAAAAGVIALCGSPEESPLGPVYFRIESQELDTIVDWLTA